MAGTETNICDLFIYGLLNADSTLKAITPRFYTEVAPDDAAMPLVMIRCISPGRDLMAVGAIRQAVPCVYLVVGMAYATSFGGDLATIAQRIDTDLHRSSGAVTGGTVHSCIREAPYRMVEQAPDGRTIRHLGGRYRLLAT